jgi:hypothetical protein
LNRRRERTQHVKSRATDCIRLASTQVLVAYLNTAHRDYTTACLLANSTPWTARSVILYITHRTLNLQKSVFLSLRERLVAR